MPDTAQLEKATFGGGCFWCTEAIFEQLTGVQSVVSGYSGGTAANPTYDLVCSGESGHAEVVQITFDPQVIPYADLLEVFWKYRSVIFYHDDTQRKLAEDYKQKLDASGAFSRPIVSQIVPFDMFYPAEKYHQDYYRNNPAQGYCSYIIGPKLEKLRQVFRNKLQPSGVS
jgi:peptide methionine sulfoxide reductase MsrA